MNTPTLMQSEEKIAPLNRKSKTITVNISQCLSTTVKIELPEEVDEDDPMVLEQAVNEQIMLPSDYLECEGNYKWIIDDFCVTI